MKIHMYSAPDVDAYLSVYMWMYTYIVAVCIYIVHVYMLVMSVYVWMYTYVVAVYVYIVHVYTCMKMQIYSAPDVDAYTSVYVWMYTCMVALYLHIVVYMSVG